MRYVVFIRRTQTGYSADVPDVPGCVATAKSVNGARKNITRAIELHLDMLRQAGDRIPRPRQRVEFVIDPNEQEEICTWVEVAEPQPA